MWRDPIGYQGGVNVYGYVNGQPLTLIDPMGLEWAYEPENVGKNCGEFRFETIAEKETFKGKRPAYSVTYIVPNKCKKENCCKSVRLVQAVQPKGLKESHIDMKGIFEIYAQYLKKHYAKNSSGMPLPGYVEMGGATNEFDKKDDPGVTGVSRRVLVDSPDGTQYFEVCAICESNKDGVTKDLNLGCVRFKSENYVPSSTDGLENTVTKPGNFTVSDLTPPKPNGIWNRAVKAFADDAGSGKTPPQLTAGSPYYIQRIFK